MGGAPLGEPRRHARLPSPEACDPDSTAPSRVARVVRLGSVERHGNAKARGAALQTPPECAAWLARLGSIEPRANWRASLFLKCGPLVWQRGRCGQASKVCTRPSLRSNWRASL